MILPLPGPARLRYCRWLADAPRAETARRVRQGRA